MPYSYWIALDGLGAELSALVLEAREMFHELDDLFVAHAQAHALRLARQDCTLHQGVCRHQVELRGDGLRVEGVAEHALRLRLLLRPHAQQIACAEVAAVHAHHGVAAPALEERAADPNEGDEHSPHDQDHEAHDPALALSQDFQHASSPRLRSGRQPEGRRRERRV